MIAKGKIIDISNEPLMGANIFLTSNEDNFRYGATSNENGNFELEIKKGDENNLVTFSYVGFKTEKIKANELENLNITLLEDSEQLDEIVIVASRPKKVVVESKLSVFFNKYGIAIASASVLGLGLLLFKIKS